MHATSRVEGDIEEWGPGDLRIAAPAYVEGDVCERDIGDTFVDSGTVDGSMECLDRGHDEDYDRDSEEYGYEDSDDDDDEDEDEDDDDDDDEDD